MKDPRIELIERWVNQPQDNQTGYLDSNDGLDRKHLMNLIGLLIVRTGGVDAAQLLYDDLREMGDADDYDQIEFLVASLNLALNGTDDYPERVQDEYITNPRNVLEGSYETVFGAFVRASEALRTYVEERDFDSILGIDDFNAIDEMDPDNLVVPIAREQLATLGAHLYNIQDTMAFVEELVNIGESKHDFPDEVEYLSTLLNQTGETFFQVVGLTEHKERLLK